MQSLDDTLAILSFGKLSVSVQTVIPMSGLQDRKFRSCCCPRIFVKLERKFVFHIVSAGLIEDLSESIKMRKSSGDRCDPSKNKNKNKKERLIARPPRVVRRFHR